MDFFSRQDAARKHTSQLVFYFVLAVLGTVAGCYVVAAIALSDDHQTLHWDPDIFGGVAGVVLLIICFGCWQKFAELAQGGSAVAVMLGGRPISPQTSDPAERRLLNVVEEMALASGTRIPDVYLLDHEEGINAFAAGHTPDDTIIGVTAGSVKAFNREQLQGVIAHEFSHILNGDMRLNMRLMGWIYGITCLSTVGYWTLRLMGNSRGNRKGNGQAAFALIGAGFLIIGIIGAFFGNLIRAAVSRQREFLADASAVQFTRYPEGIGSALRKILNGSQGSSLENPHAAEAGHFLFASGVSSGFTRLFATHPPLTDRIAAIENHPFEGPASTPEPAPPENALEEALGVSALAGGSAIASAPSASSLPTPLSPAAGAQPEDINSQLRDASRESAGACAILLGLLLSTDPALREKQIEQIQGLTAPAIPQEINTLAPFLAEVTAVQKLPLMDLCLPTLRTLSTDQINRLIECLDRVINSDNQIDLFEFTLQRIVRRHLLARQNGSTRIPVKFTSLLPLRSECELLLSALAHLGTSDETEATRAFVRGSAFLALETAAGKLSPMEDCGIDSIEKALNRVAQASPALKNKLVQACGQTVMTDGVVYPEEAALVRAIADSLDCAVPILNPQS